MWVVVVSMAKEPDFLLPQVAFDATFDNYSDVLTSGSLHLLDYLRNSLVVSAVAALAATLFASLAAYAITRLKFPGRLLIPLVLLAFSMFPQISIVGYLFKDDDRSGVDQYLRRSYFPLHYVGTAAGAVDHA